MANIIIYTSSHCPYCKMAKDLLNSKQANFTEVRIDLDEKKRVEMMEKSQRKTVPQIFINDQPIGGYDDLASLAKSGKLDELLK